MGHADSNAVVPVVVGRVVDTAMLLDIVLGSFCKAGGPPFNNGTCSNISSGFLLSSFH